MKTFPIAGYFCINLEHRKDRYRSFTEQMAKTKHRWIVPIQERVRPGVWYGSFAEVKDRIPPLAAYLKAFPEATQLGAIGCYHAHIHVLEEIAAQNTDRWYVVFEDDVRIRSADWLTVLGGLRLPSGCENTNVVFVDLLGDRLAEDQIEDKWFRMSRTFPNYHGAHCYVVLGSQAARNVLGALERCPYLADVDGLIAACGESLAWYPEVVGMRWMRSDRSRWKVARYPRKIEGLEINPVEDGFMIYQPDKDRVHYLNATAVLVLELCDGRRSAGEIAELVRKACRLPKVPRTEVDEALGRMTGEGLVERTPTGGRTTRAPMRRVRRKKR